MRCKLMMVGLLIMGVLTMKAFHVKIYGHVGGSYMKIPMKLTLEKFCL